MNILNAILSKIIPSAAQPSPGMTQPSPLIPTNPAMPLPEVDVSDVVNSLAKGRMDNLNWKSSIVDLLKVLDMDSSLHARRELAQELQYKGDTSDSAALNIWLHKEVMRKLAENGGKIPDDLKH